MSHRIILIVFALVFPLSQSVFAITADEILQKVENRYIGKTSKSDSKMKLIDSGGKTRTRQMIVSRRKIDNNNKDNFILFLAPPDMKDTSFLVNEKNREKQKRIYLSAMKNVRKIVATDYGINFVSSDFTYEDMEDIHADDYACSNLVEEKLDGEDVYSIDCTKKDANTSYSMSTLKVSKDKFVILKALMFDKADPSKQIKEMTAKNLKKFQDIWTPMEVTMKDLKKNSSTVLEVNKIDYDLPLEDEIFSERNMKK